MFVYRAEFFAMKPGLAFLALGLIITLPLTFGTITIDSLNFNLYWMLLGVTLSVLGLQSFYFGCLAQVLCDYSGPRSLQVDWCLSDIRRLSSGASECSFWASSWPGRSPSTTSHTASSCHGPRAVVDHVAVTGSLLMIMSFQTFCFTLLLNATGVKYGQATALRRRPVRDGSH